MIFMLDVIHGYRTIYPMGLAMACSFNPELVSSCTAMAAKEAAAGGTHLTFAPMVDLSRDPRWGRVMESCGEDPHLAAVMGRCQVKAFQGDDISSAEHLAACVKHFAGYGGVEGGRDYDSVEISEHSLRQYYLPSYKACIDAGVKMLMPSFNNLCGVPSTANSHLMRDILRDEWNYKGAVISDWAAIDELVAHGVAENLKEAAKLAFENGCNIEMVSKAYYKHLAELVREGEISEAAIDESVLCVLRLKEELGLFDDPYHGADDTRGKAMYLCKEHKRLARKAAEEAAVLLKNNGVLPFSDKVKTVAVIGPYAEDKSLLGNWEAYGKVDETVNVCEGVAKLLPEAKILTAKGCSYLFTDKDTSGFEEAKKIAKDADAVIICVGEPWDYSGESFCRTDISLPGVQSELIKEICEINKNSAVVLFNGRPLALTDICDHAPAILEMWFPGSEGGSAAANLIFGKVNPSGKLAMSFPRAVGQCPVYYNRINTGRPKTTPDEEFQRFTSSYLDCGKLPLFFFGQGLSYTDFVYEKLELDKSQITDTDTLTATVTLKNIGSREGMEVVQLYLRDMVSSTVRPIQELIAFKKVCLGAGESLEVKFEISEQMLRFWNAKNEFVSESGEFTLSVGFADHLLHGQKFRLVKGK
jgi:beta-glucosidase